MIRWALWYIVIVIMCFRLRGEEFHCKPPPYLIPGGSLLLEYQNQTKLYDINETVEYKCKVGYSMRNGNLSKAFCQYENYMTKWVGPNMICSPVSCGNLETIQNAHIEGSKFTYPSKVTYRCLTGYVLEGSRTRYCKATGYWTGRLPSCNPIDCGSPRTVLHASAEGSTFTYLSTIIYRCVDGYTIRGSITTQCNATGHWTGIAPTCHYDIANHKPTMSSSVQPPMYHYNAVDGKPSTGATFDETLLQCFSTSEKNTVEQPYWQVDFTSQKAVKWITLIHSRYCCQIKMSQFQIYLANSSMAVRNRTLPPNAQHCYTHGYIWMDKTISTLDEATINVECDNVVYGQYLIVVRVINMVGIMSFCKLMVLQCDDNSYGQLCDKKCTCRDDNEECHKITGQCHSGCKDGFWGIDCKNPCSNGYFGQNCSQRCNCKFKRDICNATTGECQWGCKGYYIPPNCLFQCPDMRYGATCKEKCTCRDDKEVCDKHSGSCKSRCKNGFTGTACKTRCNDKNFGFNCEHTCNCKDKNEICEKTDGHCHSGCRDGYLPPTCLSQCPKGAFGPPTCNGSCHCEEPRCNYTNGNCINGSCSAGYTGKNCQSPCELGRYGDNCESICNCLDNNKCSNVRGACDECPTGYTHKETSCKTRTMIGNGTQTLYNSVGQECPEGAFGPPTCDRSCHCKESACNYTNGECFYGHCAAGYRGKYCQSPCKTGKYGEKCASKCNCLDNRKCNNVHGACFKCPTGYTFKEMSCKNKCKAGRFGNNCKYNCHCKNHEEVCHHVTGRCKTGCADKWRGMKCQRRKTKTDGDANPVVQANTISGFAIALMAAASVLTLAVATYIGVFFLKSKRLDRNLEANQSNSQYDEQSSMLSSKQNTKKNYTVSKSHKMAINQFTNRDTSYEVTTDQDITTYTSDGSSQSKRRWHSEKRHNRRTIKDFHRSGRKRKRMSHRNKSRRV